jgi:hypothetical protein
MAVFILAFGGVGDCINVLRSTELAGVRYHASEVKTVFESQ